MKRTIRLTEAKLRKMIQEAVETELPLYKFDKPSRPTWRGVPDTQFIYHNHWADPEIIYNGHTYNAEAIEGALWDEYNEECEETGEEPTYEGYNQWFDIERAKDYLNDCEYGQCYEK